MLRAELDTAAQSVYLVGDTPEGAQSKKIGAYDRREGELVNGRWAYVKRDDSGTMMWYDDIEPVQWVIGDANDLGSSESYCRCRDTASSPEHVSAEWQVGLKGKAIPAPSLRCLPGAEGEAALAAHNAEVARKKAEAAQAIRGELDAAARTVYLLGDTPSNAQKERLGVFDRREGDLVNGRWAYVKRDDSETMIWYDDTEPVAWLVGDLENLGSTSAGCRCRDLAASPDRVTSSWEVGVKGKPVAAPSLRCLSGVEGEVAMAEFTGDSPLILSCMAGDVAQVTHILAGGASVDCVNKMGDTPLIVCCRKGHTQVAALLLEEKAAVNGANEAGVSPLAASCMEGHSALAAMLLNEGAAVNATTSELDTPLTLCCRSGHTEIAELLFDNDADVNHVNAGGQTALALASLSGHRSCEVFMEEVAICTELAWRRSTVPRKAGALWYCNIIDVTLRLSPLAINHGAAETALELASSHGTAPANVADLRPQLEAARSMQHDAEEGSSCVFHFIKAHELLADSAIEHLPSHQELLTTKPHWLETRVINFSDACVGAYTNSIVAVSHRWDDPSQPDPGGDQLREIRSHLHLNPQIELVFYDYSSMPQGRKLPHEQLEFKRMLPNINLLYLGCSVLILMDRTYLGCATKRGRIHLLFPSPYMEEHACAGLTPCVHALYIFAGASGPNLRVGLRCNWQRLMGS